MNVNISDELYKAMMERQKVGEPFEVLVWSLLTENKILREASGQLMGGMLKNAFNSSKITDEMIEEALNEMRKEGKDTPQKGTKLNVP